MRITQIYEWLRIKKKQTGFTLVESLVAISILSLSIAATFTAAQNGIKNSTIAKDQTAAFYLAQEVMEYIKNVRDENALYSIVNPDTPRNWLFGIYPSGSPCEFGKVCQIDVPLNVVRGCPTIGAASTGVAITNDPPYLCDNLRQDTVTGIFGYTATWPVSRFKREVQIRTIANIEADTEVEVVISVSWTGSAGTRFFQASETLFNRQRPTTE
ncbi:MAG: type II secretion system protein [Candidatus Zambryskibacteria bacterium]|nr:type II secretion system protein [Candidatus Zambryskibacteria bacterium]